MILVHLLQMAPWPGAIARLETRLQDVPRLVRWRSPPS
jgi:hypothetical protein